MDEALGVGMLQGLTNLICDSSGIRERNAMLGRLLDEPFEVASAHEQGHTYPSAGRNRR